MEAEFIPYEQALALKDLGFNEPCLGYYVGKDKEVYMSNEILSAPFQFRLESKTTFVAPTFSQAFRWSREKYKLFGEINLTTKQEDVEVFEFFVLTVDDCLFDDSKDYNIYEEAELECLKKLIEIVKEKQIIWKNKTTNN